VAAPQSYGLQHQLRAFGLPLWTQRLQQQPVAIELPADARA
jgi:hypothetical protein